MTGASFSEWLRRHNFKNVTAAKALGCGVNTIARYSKPGAKIPRYIALACAAISYGLKPME